jgi:hypothetical protein
MLRYRLYRVFGVPGIVFGIFIAALGCFTIFTSWSGAILITIGSFWIFTVASCKIDVRRFRIMFPFELFGFISIGDWLYVRPDMMLDLTITRKPFRIRCASNKIIDVRDSKYIIFLYDNIKKKRFVILKSKSIEKAEDELSRLSDLLGIHIKQNKFIPKYKTLRINN